MQYLMHCCYFVYCTENNLLVICSKLTETLVYKKYCGELPTSGCIAYTKLDNLQQILEIFKFPTKTPFSLQTYKQQIVFSVDLIIIIIYRYPYNYCIFSQVLTNLLGVSFVNIVEANGMGIDKPDVRYVI